MGRIQQIVILAGGRGERLRPLTDETPKPLAPVNGTPFLDFLLASAVDAGIRSALLLVGYRSDAVLERYKRRTCPGLTIEFSVGTADDQTGRRLLDAYSLLDPRFLLVYGDTYWPIPLDEMVKFYEERNALVSTTVFNNRLGTGEYGSENNIEVGDAGFVKRYDKGRKSPGLNGVDIGYFIVDRNALSVEEHANISFEEHVLPPLIARRQLIGYQTDTQYYYLTDLTSLRRFEAASREQGIRPLRCDPAHEVL